MNTGSTALGLCFATVGGISVGNFSTSSSLWFCSSKMSTISLLFWFPGFMQVKPFFWAVVYSLPLLQVVTLSAEDDDMPVMCLAEAISILWAEFIQFINHNHNYQQYKSFWQQLVHQLTSYVYLVQPLLKLSMRGELGSGVVSLQQQQANISSSFCTELSVQLLTCMDHLLGTQAQAEKRAQTQKKRGKTRKVVRLMCGTRSFSLVETSGAEWVNCEFKPGCFGLRPVGTCSSPWIEILRALNIPLQRLNILVIKYFSLNPARIYNFSSFL